MEVSEDFAGNVPEIQILILGILSDLIFKAGSIVGAFLVVGCVGVFMIYIVNGIFIVGYILIQLLVGDGRSDQSISKSSIYQLIYEQILLHRLWSSRSRAPDSKNKINFNGNVNQRFVIKR